MTKKIHDITIIGAGPVGLFAAFYAGLRGASVNIIEALSELGGKPAILYPEKMIYDIAAYPAITGRELTKNLLEQLERFKDTTQISLKEEVKYFEKEDGIFKIVTNKTQHFSKAIIIACGTGAFSPRELGLDGEENFADKSLFYNVTRLEDFKNKNVVICGGGDSAVDWALALEPLAKSVTIIHRRDSFRAHEYSLELLEKSSVKILTPYLAKELKGNDGQLRSINIEKVKSDELLELNLDNLIVSYGFKSSNKNLKNWNIDHKLSSIFTSNLLETNMEGVYAIGDAASYDGKIDLIAIGFGEAPIAVSQALLYINPNAKLRSLHSTSLIKE
ncbi:NAD(P)/FAD-dependent oxidoreductase [Gemella sp. 19428wG2_WT2a]|nr:NAD(P)/FAD-dependent oxidoreductase [Gemella sp. 19428wG2_WT2a]TFU58837.1 NAD(P)/FAD-dependent oxidoreductase [Gemella sp. WT2a]